MVLQPSNMYLNSTSRHWTEIFLWYAWKWLNVAKKCSQIPVNLNITWLYYHSPGNNDDDDDNNNNNNNNNNRPQ